MPTEKYYYNVKLPNGTYWSGAESIAPQGADLSTASRVSGGTPTTSNPSMFSSNEGASIVQSQTDKLNKISSNPNATMDKAIPVDSTKTSSTITSVTPTAPTPTKVTLVNPDTQQSVSFEGESINQSTIQSYLDSGYSVSEAAGSLPSWLQGGGIQPKQTPEQKAQVEVDQAVDDLKGLIDNLNKFTVSDADLANQISGITSVWEARISGMQRVNFARKDSINTLGIRLGSRYAGGSGGQFGGIVSEEERQGVTRIAALEGEKQAAIAAARFAAMQQNWTVYSRKIDLAEKAHERKLQELENLQKITIEQNKLLAEERKQEEQNFLKYFQEPINKLLNDVAKGGAPKDVIEAISNATSLADAYTLAGSYLSEPPAIVEEWKWVNSERAKQGIAPVDLESYMNIDANRKRSIVNVNQSGLNPAQLSNFLRITDKFQADPIIMAAENGRTAKLIADQVLADPGNAANQLKSLYVLVKNLDQGTAVREGELALAQKTQSYYETVGNSITRLSKGQVISQKAAVQLANATKELVSAWESSAVTRTKRYVSQANNADPVVGQAFGSYLSDYDESTGTAEFTVQNEAQAQQKVENMYGQYGSAIDAIIQAEPGISYAEILQTLGQ